VVVKRTIASFDSVETAYRVPDRYNVVEQFKKRETAKGCYLVLMYGSKRRKTHSLLF